MAVSKYNIFMKRENCMNLFIKFNTLCFQSFKMAEKFDLSTCLKITKTVTWVSTNMCQM